MVFEKESSEKLAVGVYTELAKRIMNGELKPGTRLVENQIARQFGVSRTPTREAFQRLASDGLIELIPNKGCSIKGLTRKDVEEIFSLRKVLELDAARSSISEMDQADIEFLEKIVTESNNILDQLMRGVPMQSSKLLGLGNAFHRRLVTYCTNSRQIEVYENLVNLIQMIRTMDQSLMENFRTDLRELSEILDALSMKDYESAYASIKNHLEQSGARIIKYFSSPFERQKHVIAVIMTSEHLWWRTIAATFQNLGTLSGFKVTIMDPQLDDRQLQKIVDRIVAARPDGVAFTGLDSLSVNAQVKRIMDEGIPVVPFNVIPKELHGPAVTGDNFHAGIIGGRAMAEIWRSSHGNENPYVCLLGHPSLTVDRDRTYGMLDGFREYFPNATVVAECDVPQTQDGSRDQTRRLLDAHPEVNVFACSCDAVALGASQALQERGRGSVDDCVLGCVDGSLPGFISMRQNTRTGYKVQVSYPCYEMAHYTWNTLVKVMDGSLTGPQIIYIPSEYIAPDKVDAYVKRQYPEEYEAFVSIPAE